MSGRDCTTTPLGDIGHGVSAELRYVDGELYGVAYWHACAGVRREDWIPARPRVDSGWDVVSVEPLTLSPSILCRACSFHGYIRESRWVPA